MDGSDSLYQEELEACTSNEDNYKMQGFDETYLFSQGLAVCNDETLNIVTPLFINDVYKLENFMVCSNEENILQPLLMPC